MTLCVVDDCDKPTVGQGLCRKHYMRQQRHGDPLLVTRSPRVTVEGVRCCTCKEVKPIEGFSLMGNGKPRGACRVCCSIGQRPWQYRRKYGITVEDYEALVVQQDGRCAICGTRFPGNGKAEWCIDHDHDTKKVRGLLCAQCNSGLGFFSDDPERLAAAVEYLRSRS